MKLSKVIFLSLIMLSMTAACATAGDKRRDKAPPSPLDGYTIHVSAPHVMDGEVMGPFSSLLQTDQRRHYPMHSFRVHRTQRPHDGG